MRKCVRCHKEKEDWEFNFQSAKKSGLNSYCRDCTKEKVRENALHRCYGITDAQYKLMLTSQKGVCAICQQFETKETGNGIDPLSVDHEHKTNKIRGLLCNKCNRGLGIFNDNSELLRKAAAYLEQS